MDARAFKQFIDQAAKLPRRQRVDLADALQRGLRQEQAVDVIEAPGAPRACPHLPNYLGWHRALDGDRIGSAEILLRSALGAAPDVTVT